MTYHWELCLQVKEFHPDVCKDLENADLIMRRVIEAYQVTLCTILVFCTSAYGCCHNNHDQTSSDNYNSQRKRGLKRIQNCEGTFEIKPQTKLCAI
jgi:hypothetical protein